MYQGDWALVVSARCSRPMGDGRADHICGPRAGCRAANPEGSEAGLQRLARGEVMVAAIHLHRLDGDDDAANIEAVAAAPGLHDAVVISFARREQGIVTAPGNPLKLSDIASVAKSRARLAQRPPGAGAQLLLLALLARAN